MLKKIYISPCLDILEIRSNQVFLQGSGVYNEERNLRYGGVDIDGELDPD